MYTQLLAICLLAVLLILGTGTALADKPTGMDGQGNKTNWVSDGGFDQWGYNYRARMFSGDHCAAYHGAEWCQPYDGTQMIIKWNEAMRSSSDLDGDGWVDEHFGFPSYIGSGAWATYHQSGTYRGEDGNVHTWTWFGKFVAKPSADYDCEANGGVTVWGGEFCEIESVYNIPDAGVHGVERKAVLPGYGTY